MIEIECPLCGEQFRVKDSLKGGSVNCRGCRELIEVPGSDAYDTLLKIGVGLVGSVVLAIGCFLLLTGHVGVGIGVLLAAGLIGLVVFVGL